METIVNNGGVVNVGKASKTSLEGWKRHPVKSSEFHEEPSKTSLEGWKLPIKLRIEFFFGDLKNFLRGMETVTSLDGLEERPTSKTSLEGWKLLTGSASV